MSTITCGARGRDPAKNLPVDALDGAKSGFALGDLWAALDELEEDHLIEEIVEGLQNNVDAANQEGEECDHGSAYSDSNNEAGDSGDDEDKLYFPRCQRATLGETLCTVTRTWWTTQ
eukprot:jgi/Tetstr1/436655/TSEL_025450.t1